MSAFWLDPPWLNADTGQGYAMALTPCPLDQWLPLLATPAQRQRKDGLHKLTRIPAPAFALAPGYVQDCDAAAALVFEQVKHRLPDGFSAEDSGLAVNALIAAARLVPDDLCVLACAQPGADYRLVAASLCSPSYWHLQDKLGASLDGIHAPVPGLNAQLGERMRAFFARLPMDRVFVRRNFFVHAERELFQPLPDIQDYRRVPVQQLVIRSERQALRRISERAVLFSIRVDLRPLVEICAWPQALGQLHRTLQGLNAAQRRAFGSVDKFARVSALVEHWGR